MLEFKLIHVSKMALVVGQDLRGLLAWNMMIYAWFLYLGNWQWHTPRGFWLAVFLWYVGCWAVNLYLNQCWLTIKRNPTEWVLTIKVKRHHSGKPITKHDFWKLWKNMLSQGLFHELIFTHVSNSLDKFHCFYLVPGREITIYFCTYHGRIVFVACAKWW